MSIIQDIPGIVIDCEETPSLFRGLGDKLWVYREIP